VTVALAKHFDNEIKLPSDNEFSLLMYSFRHNTGIMTATCTLDGTEIKIFRPSCADIQRRTYSGKK
jgi:hypothetical protein